MKRFLGILLTLVLVFSLAGISLPSPVLAAQPSEAWVARYNGPASSGDGANAIVVDSSGNAYVTGGSDSSGTHSDYATIKYDADGNELWVVRYNGPASIGDRAEAIALDSFGNVYVTGSSDGGSGTSDDYATVKYVQYVPPPSEVWVDDDYTPDGYNDGHTWGYDAFAKIQDGIDAVAGSVVHVAAGTYYENITLVDGVQLLGAGADVTTIDGGRAGSVVRAANVGPSTEINGFTITNGSVTTWGDGGGGMYNFDSSPTVTNCTFSNNSATAGWGGGIRNHNSSPTVTNCIFFENSAAEAGGGMYNYASSPMVVNCTFSGNSGGWGGAVHNGDHSSPMVTNCTFSSNSASNGGGGMFNGDSSPTVTNCTFSSNRARIFGGGMQNSNSSPTVTNCAFSANSAGSGGGMKNINSSPTVTNCTFFDNLAGGWGGGMNNEKSSPMVTNCTFSSNSAIVGGGIFNGESSPTVTNCILWDNGEEIANDVTSTPLVTYSDIQGGYSGVGNIDADPMFVNPTNDDYHLQAGSPCIDAGTNEGAPIDDIERNSRPLDGDGDGTATTDMGAYEYVPPPTAVEATVDFDPDTLNLKSKGKVVTVYIEFPEGYAANDIDVTTVFLNDVIQAEPKPTEIGDYNSNGIGDLMVKFDRAAVQSILEPGDEVELTVSGQLTDGTPFEGSDTIRVIEKGKK